MYENPPIKILPFAEVWKVTETGPVNVSKEYADESHPDVPSFIALLLVVVALLPMKVNVSQFKIGDGVGVCVDVFVGVGVEVDVSVFVGVGVDVDVSVFVGVGVEVDVSVFVGVGVGVSVFVGVGVSVFVGVGV